MSTGSTSAKTRWGRMGSVMKRASTLVTIANTISAPRTSSEDNADTVSLRRSTSRASLSQALFGGGSKTADNHAPSPIAESPAREFQATIPDPATKTVADEGLGPSPLAKNPSSAPTEPDIPAPVAATDPVPELAAPEQKEMDTASHPLIDSSAGNPGTFKDPLDDDLPQVKSIFDPSSSPEPAPRVVAEIPQPLAPAIEQSNSYFNKPMAESIKGVSTDDLHNIPPAPIPVPPEFVRAVDENSIAPLAAAEPTPEPASVPAPSRVSPPPSVRPSRSPSVAPAPASRAPSTRALPVPISRAVSNQPESAPVVVPVSRAPSVQPEAVPVIAPVLISRAPSPQPEPEPVIEPVSVSRAPEPEPVVVPVSRAPEPEPEPEPVVIAISRAPEPVPVVVPVSRAPSSQPLPPIPVFHSPSNQPPPISRAPSPQIPAPAHVSRAPSRQPTISTVPVTRQPSEASSIAVIPAPIHVTEPERAQPVESFPNPHPAFSFPSTAPVEAPIPAAPIAPQVMPQPDPFANPFGDPYGGHDIWGGAITNPGFERSAPVVPTYPQSTPAHPTVEPKKDELHSDPWGQLPVAAAVVAAGVVGMDRIANISKESRKLARENGNRNVAAVSRELNSQPPAHVSREPSIRMPNPHDAGVAPAANVGLADEFLHPGPIPGQEPPRNDHAEMAIPRSEHSMTTTVIDNKSQAEDHQTIFMPLPSFQEVTSGKYPLSREGPPTDRALLMPQEPEEIHPTSSMVIPVPVPAPIPFPAYAPTVNQVEVSPLAGPSAQAVPQTYHQEGYTSTSMSNLAAETHARILTSQHQPRLHSLGWLEYHLPDGMFYYVHPTRKLVTDLNLRRDGVLDRVSTWMDEDGREGESVGVFVEGWIVERIEGVPRALGGGIPKGKAKTERDPRTMILERYWVDHHGRSVVKDEESIFPPGRGNGNGNGNGYSYGYNGGIRNGAPKGKRQSSMASGGYGTVPRKNDDDQLDMEYKYWTFMEAHPAHTALPPRAKAEAMDVLNWAWTDRLLPSHRPIPPPFNQEECNELSTLLRSFGSDKIDENGIETRIISRILIRVAMWRQTYFRPHKPLPTDPHFSSGAAAPQSNSISISNVVQTVSAYLLFGIPYLFAENTNTSSSSRAGGGEEVQMMRNPRSNPMLIVGGVSCIFAAIILSTSVTFLSMPSLSSFSRISILISLSLATLSLATTGIAILRHQSDMEESTPLIQSQQPGQRFTQERKIITPRTLILSAPLVFLSYSIIAFLIAIIAHTVPGFSFWFVNLISFAL